MQLSSVVKVTQVQYIFKLRENKIKMSCEKTKSRYHVRKQNQDLMSEIKISQFNTNSAIFQLYHGRNKLIFNEMIMIFALY